MKTNPCQCQSVLNLPGPDAVTAVAAYTQDPLGFLTRCAREYGELVPIRLGGNALFCLLTNPEHITHVLKERLLFVKAEDVRLLRTILGNGLLTSEGSFWQRQRRLTQPIFHQRKIESYSQVMVDYTQMMLASWQAGDVVDVHEEMMCLTLNIVMKTIFDKDLNDNEANQISQALETTLTWFSAKMAALLMENEEPIPEDKLHQDTVKRLDETIYAMINHRRDMGETGNDLLGMLMAVEDADDGSRMSDRQIRDEVSTLILAGHETTANALSWTWFLLGQHPEVRAKLDHELKTVLHDRAPTFEDLKQLTYTTMVIQEAMRLYPPVTDLTRAATQECEIGGYTLPKGTTLIASQWVMHRDPRYFIAPELFEPNRWANDFEKSLPRGVYFPFGDGPRVCIGKGFAMMEAVLLLATIAQSFHLELAPDQVIEPQPSVTLRPKNGIQVILHNNS
ncbi:cytochrome P450 [Vacuolonema iberomarrocanum]|uniref:cytochrome P450 n=1 Tax=Vacuolonema iberomarrocanum TaxID=3454632 RepID=UPI0019E2FAD0|nr:cytochrome P450 [filamentous cyanobacterium LEGE 07170]